MFQCTQLLPSGNDGCKETATCNNWLQGKDTSREDQHPQLMHQQKAQQSKSRDSNFGGSSRTVGEKKTKRTAYGQGLKGRQSLPVDEGGRIWHAHGGGCLIAHFSLFASNGSLVTR